jgi:hypothetical protein
MVKGAGKLYPEGSCHNIFSRSLAFASSYQQHLLLSKVETRPQNPHYAWMPKETRNDGSAMMRAYESVHCGSIKKPISAPNPSRA